jgi:hypothetical protein
LSLGFQTSKRDGVIYRGGALALRGAALLLIGWTESKAQELSALALFDSAGHPKLLAIDRHVAPIVGV